MPTTFSATATTAMAAANTTRSANTSPIPMTAARYTPDFSLPRRFEFTRLNVRVVPLVRSRPSTVDGPLWPRWPSRRSVRRWPASRSAGHPRGCVSPRSEWPHSPSLGETSLAAMC
jgi:hypothetical protein